METEQSTSAQTVQQAPSQKVPLKKRFKKAKRFVRYCILRCLYGAASLLPLPAAMAIGRGLCRIGYFIPPLRRKALAGLSIAFPELSDGQRLKIVRDMFDHFGNFIGEVCCIDKITPRVNDYVELPEEDFQRYCGAVDEGRGVLLATGHVGNFELMARRLGLIGYQSSVVAKVSSDPHMTAFIDRLRRNGGYKMIWRGQGPKGSAFQAIRDAIGRGEPIGLLIDQDTKGHGVFVDFFGRKAFTPNGLAVLALETGCAVITSFIHRKPEGGHVIHVERIQVERTEDRERDVQALMQRLTDSVERTIRTEPAAWPWFHERWKHRPPEEHDAPLQESSGASLPDGPSAGVPAAASPTMQAEGGTRSPKPPAPQASGTTSNTQANLP